MQDKIIVGNGVTGNVGSCKTEIAKIYSEFGLIKQGVVHIQTNSCTGEVKEYSTWEPGPVLIIGMVLITVAIIVGSIFAAVDYSSKRDRMH